MLNVKIRETEVGVVIGRFQVHEIHEGHRQIINSVFERHKRVLILIGSTPTLKVTRNNPLDYQTRRLMLQEEFPDAIILPIKDNPSDAEWSKTVDMKIEEIFEGISENKNATLYGSRDGFIPYYSGKYPTVELDPTVVISGSEVRKQISLEVRSSPDFRRGVVYAAYNKYSQAFLTVDIACLKNENNKVYVALVRKANDIKDKWRFPGGFVDPLKDKCAEDAVKRETSEEINVEIGDAYYIGSFKVNDWRYRKESDSIFTLLYKVPYIFGALNVGDDLAGGKAFWYELPIENPEIAETIMIPEHIPLMRGLITHLKKEF